MLDLYQRAEALMESGVWVVCADEKTSIQARERIHPVDPEIPGHSARVASRYSRQGALQLFAGLSVADGKVYGCCRERRQFADFKAFFLEVLLGEALRRKVREIRLILDNGSTHAPKQLEGWLAEQQRENDWPFTVVVNWLPRYASWLDQIEIWFSVLQRKVLTPNHFRNLEELSQQIMDFIEHYDRSAKPIEWSYTVAQMEEKFGTN